MTAEEDVRETAARDDGGGGVGTTACVCAEGLAVCVQLEL